MNLQPISPDMRADQYVYCIVCSGRCGTRHGGANVQAWADLDATPGTFYCDNCAHTPPSIYSDMKKAGLVTGHHYGDLYVLDTPEARAILAKHGRKVDGWNVQPFIDQVTGARSLDLPFQYPEE